MIVLSIAFAPIVELINQNSQIILLANPKFLSFKTATDLNPANREGQGDVKRLINCILVVMYHMNL
jgi:hypothetical protein